MYNPNSKRYSNYTSLTYIVKEQFKYMLDRQRKQTYGYTKGKGEGIRRLGLTDALSYI